MPCESLKPNTLCEIVCGPHKLSQWKHPEAIGRFCTFVGPLSEAMRTEFGADLCCCLARLVEVRIGAQDWGCCPHTLRPIVPPGDPGDVDEIFGIPSRIEQVREQCARLAADLSALIDSSNARRLAGVRPAAVKQGEPLHEPSRHTADGEAATALPNGELRARWRKK